MIASYAGDAGHASGWREWRLQGSVAHLSWVQERRGRRNRVGEANVLRMQELSLVRKNLSRLLAVQYGEVGGHVDIDAGVWGQAARGLSA